MIKLFSPIIKKMAGNMITVDEHDLKDLYYSSGPYLCELEMRILSWTLQQLDGDYIEIGVNEGHNAHNMCRNNPKKMIWGVDLVDGSTMPPEQMHEQPSGMSVGARCMWENNFNLILHDSRTVGIPDNIGMVFIDADHSYEGVKADTENVLKQVAKGTFIIWHDYQPIQKPHYRVKDYIDSEVKLDLFRFEGTWLIGGFVK
jgi:hypothetical protein